MHCTTSLFMKPLDFMTSVTFSDGFSALSGLSTFFATLLSDRPTTPGVPQVPAGNAGGGRNPVSFFMLRRLNASDDSVSGVQSAVGSPTPALTVMAQTPLATPSASHDWSPSLQVNVVLVFPGVAAADPMSQRAEQFPFRPGTIAAGAGDSAMTVNPIAASGPSRESFVLGRAAAR